MRHVALRRKWFGAGANSVRKVDLMLTILAFVFALAVLIAVHEYGHYRVARAFGVKVLCFSIGFGRPILHWRSRRSSTEFVIAMFPIGGFVKMLDERDGPVSPGERSSAFNNQSLLARASIVLAGPAANLLLAALLYSLVSWVGTKVPSSVVSGPVSGSVADLAGLRSGDRVIGAKIGDRDQSPVIAFEDLHWAITQSVIGGQDLHLTVKRPGVSGELELDLLLSTIVVREADAELVRRVGITGPYSPPDIGGVTAGGAAQSAGLLAGDRVISVDGRPVSDAQELRRLIQRSGSSGAVKPADWMISRNGKALPLVVTPHISLEGNNPIGRIGAMVGSPPELVDQRFGFLDGLFRGVKKTWDSASLTLTMIGRIVVGDASLSNLSGPLTIADYAGKTASIGLLQYLTFLALISVSLGVLNMLPLPVLDGGHLMYYLWEGVTGRPVSELVQTQLQRVGWFALILISAIALSNDISRLLG